MNAVQIVLFVTIVIIIVYVLLLNAGSVEERFPLIEKFRQIFSKTNCNGNESIVTHDECVEEAIRDAAADIITTLTDEADQTQSLLQDLIATIDDGVDVNSTLVGIDPTVEAQLQALIEAALEAVEPHEVEVVNFPDMQATLQAALQWAANNLQYDVLATQNGSWTVDLTAATISAIQTAFENALGNVVVDVFVTNTTITVALDTATLAALEEINVNVLGQPISVDVSNEITLDAATVNGIASAIAGQTLDVNITGQPISITGTVDLGDVSSLTNWLSVNDLNIDDAAIIAAINAVAVADPTDDDVEVELTSMVEIGCEVGGTQWYTFYERRYDELGGLISSTQYFTDGVTLTTTLPGTVIDANCIPLADEIVAKQRDVLGGCVSFSGTTDAVLAVPPGAKGCLKYIGYTAAIGVVRIAFDGSSPATTAYPEFAGDHTLNIDGVDLSLLVFKGTDVTSVYTVCYEEYL